ncbi:hypothetical protein D3C72_1858500 [compost metagenome]
MQKQKRPEGKADQYALCQVSKDDEYKSHHENNGITARGANEGRKLPFLCHVPAYDSQHRGKCGQRQVACKRCRNEHERKHEHRMHDAGHRASRTGAHIGRGASNSAGHTDAAKQG